MVYKQQFATLQWSKVPPNTWLRVVIPDPTNCCIRAIRTAGLFITYRAYFVNSEYIKHPEKRQFNLVFPYNKWDMAVQAINPIHRDPTKPVEFEFMKRNNNIVIREWIQV